jgi:predicted component of type VI protein secretion system
MRRSFVGVAVAVLVCLTAVSAFAQAAPEAKPPEKPKTFLDEVNLFAYIENSFVGNLRGAGRGNVNELRLYDLSADYTFNMAEFKIYKDPSDAHPFGFGLSVNGGEDARKNHALGIFRGSDDVFPYNNTPPIDLLEAYVSYKIPLGDGLTIKAGKFASLLGFEVIEAPLNVNFSRSLLFTFAVPLTHVGGLLSYSFGDVFTMTAGPVVGWDVAKDNNSSMSVMGQFILTPMKDLIIGFNWITGPEQNSNNKPIRTVLDWTFTYNGFKNTIVGLNFDYGWETKEASLVAAGLSDTTAKWWGIAAYYAYDWTDKWRTSFRAEYFEDQQSARTVARAPGLKTTVWETTATLRYKIWGGLLARVEYRHDQANEKAFKVGNLGPTSKAQDTLSLDVIYQFF